MDLRGLRQAQMAGNEPVDSVKKEAICRQAQETLAGDRRHTAYSYLTCNATVTLACEQVI